MTSTKKSKSKPVEGEIVDRGPAKKSGASARRGGNSENARLFNGIVAVLAAIIVIALCAWVLKFVVGILATILQLAIIVAAIGLVAALIYNFVLKGKK